MQNTKNIISAAVISVVVLAGLAAAFFFFMRSGPVAGVPQGYTSTSTPLAETVPASTTPQAGVVNSPEVSAGLQAGKGVSVTPLGTRTLLDTNVFSLALPAGWESVSPAMGAVAMAAVTGEQAGFRTFLAVNHNLLGGESVSAYLQTIEGLLRQAAPNITFANENNVTIQGVPARAVEAAYSQAGMDFEVLIVMVPGKQHDVWTTSFTTTQDAWGGYRAAFYDIADSFTLK